MINVDFPLPDKPTKAVFLPDSIVRLIFFKILFSSKEKLILLNSIFPSKLIFLGSVCFSDLSFDVSSSKKILSAPANPLEHLYLDCRELLRVGMLIGDWLENS